jgi:hypothetical protein
MLDKLERLLAHRRVPVAAVVLAMLLTLPALGAGYFADDFMHRIAFRADLDIPRAMRGDWDLFRFVGPERDHLRNTMDVGIFPWWAAPSLRLAFFRPLTSLSHALDYHFLARFPAILHAESMALYAAIVIAAARFYRRLVTPAWAAGLATILYAVDDAHSLPVTWIANRNALFAALFGFAALVVHDRARRDAHRPSALLAPLLYALGLLGGEAAAATLAYLFAYALFVDEAPPRARILAIAPYAIVTAAWVVVYKSMGYGAAGSGFYVDPGTEPLAFAPALATRLPALLLAQLAGPPSDFWMGIPDPTLAVLVAAAIAVLALMALGMARVLGRDRRAAFFATGMVLSLVPMCATWPNDRLLLFSGLGAFGLVALFLARVRERAPRGKGARALAWAFVLFHAIMAPVALPVRSYAFAHLYSGYVARGDRTLPDIRPGTTLVLVNAPDLLVTGYVALLRMVDGAPPGRGVRLLATALDGNDGEIERADARTVVITLRDGFVHDAFSQVARSAKVPFSTGEVVRVAGMTAEVEEVTPDGRPRRVRFRFDVPLEDPSLVWVTWEGSGYVRTAPPAVGEKARVPSIDFYKAVFGTG